MDIPLLLLYMASVFMLIITPGPVVALVVNTSLVSGPERAILTALGSNWAALVLVMIAALILAGTLSVSASLLNCVSLLGCIFIACLALQGLKRALTNRPEKATGLLDAGKRPGGLLTGFLVGISNPKDIVFFVSFLPQFITVTESFKGSIAVLAVLWVIIDLSILFAYIFLMRHTCATKYKRPIELASSMTLLLISMGGIVYSVKVLSGE